MGVSAESIIAALGLVPHPEGGHYRETYRDQPADGSRGALTQIYFLLRAGERSAWHRVDAAEVWHHYDGAPLRLDLWLEGGPGQSFTLGKSLSTGETAHAVVPANAWQAAASLGAWTLVGCTVAPAFQFSGFEMAPKGWSPPG